jgi:hypothetical protein
MCPRIERYFFFSLSRFVCFLRRLARSFFFSPVGLPMFVVPREFGFASSM